MTNSNITLDIETGTVNNEGTLIEPQYWCDIEISLNEKSINSSLQFDCGDTWGFADSGPGIDGVLEELDLSSVDSAQYEKLVAQIEKAIDDSAPVIDETEIMAEFFNGSFCKKDNGVLHGYYNDTSIQVYELSDKTIRISVSEDLEYRVCFAKFANYDAYLEFLHSDQIWGNASSPQDFSITYSVNEYIEKNYDRELSEYAH